MESDLERESGSQNQERLFIAEKNPVYYLFEVFQILIFDLLSEHERSHIIQKKSNNKILKFEIQFRSTTWLPER